MTIYVIRHMHLVKIGFSSNLASRVRDIIRGVPTRDAVFVGHMPGDRDVEAHFHEMFSEHRFAGEWFLCTPTMEAVFDAILVKEMPQETHERILGSRRESAGEEMRKHKELLRKYSAERWPELSKRERVERLAEELGWLHSRTRDVYYASDKISLRAREAAEVQALLIAPELRGSE